MAAKGTKFIHGATPSNIAPTADGKYEVTFTNGSTDVFDTVMAAAGRTADTAGLNLAAVGVEASPKNGKLQCVDEQTNVPYVYAIGDVLQGLPELTPVAIQAGIMLARRMFGGASEAMDYKNIATAVFTPIEYGAIGLSEEEAIEAYGEANLEVYHSEFVPLEWSLSPERETDTYSGFCKVICDKTANMNVVGMHYLGPNAGEVTQGYGVAMKKVSPQCGQSRHGTARARVLRPDCLTFARHHLHHLRASTSGTSRRPSASTRPPQRSSPPSL
mmetsp:Transcript_105327/g.303941  ORF Transcript_105327/g.303941 Transcript_105327/m.303941 type:complete len:273 (-) Transcript_105327:1714-2532(-)